MSRRLSVLLLAVVLGLVGTGAVAAYVSRVNTKATAGQRMVTVLAAKAPIAAGTSAGDAVEKGFVEQQSLPANLAPPGALVDINSVKDLLVVNDIAAHQVLLAQMFSTQPQNGALTIPAGLMAITVQLGDTQRVAGFVTPGSEVAIFDTFAAGGSSSDAGSQSSAGSVTRLLLPRVQVIAVGPVALTKSQPTPVAMTLLTLALDQQQSAKVIEASTTGKLTFALLTDKSKTTPSAGVSTTTLFQ
jgi:pilus assembly protein CpaB